MFKKYFISLMLLLMLAFCLPAYATISTLQSQITLQGNGATQNFSFPFVGDQASDIAVIYTNSSGQSTTLSPSTYNVNFNSIQPNALWSVGGTVTYPLSGSPIASGTSLTIQRVLPLTQTTSLTDQGDFNPQVTEQALDTNVMQSQQISARTGSLRGTWITDTIYNFGDIVQDGTNGNDTASYYTCAIANTSGTWSTDLGNGDWVLSLPATLPLTPLPLAVASGGTGATTAGQALNNLGGISLSADNTFTGNNTFSNPLTTGSITGSGVFAATAFAPTSSTCVGSGASGFYLPSANVPGICTNGAATMNFPATGANVTGTISSGSYSVGYQINGYNAVWQDVVNQNVAVGSTAFPSTISQAGGGTHGQGNTAVGYQALNSNTTGTWNTAVGFVAMLADTTGSNNTATGQFALGTNITGSGNAAFGMDALAVSTATENTGLGFLALSLNTTGANNTAVGYAAGSAGTGNTVGTNLTFLGYEAQANANNYTNSTALGNGAVITGSNRIILGNSSISAIYAEVTSITGISDRRKKKDIQESDLGLDFVNSLQPVSYRMNNGDETLRYGFVAQDVEQALPDNLKSMVSKDGALALVTQDKDGIYHMAYDQLFAPVVKSVQTEEMQIKFLAFFVFGMFIYLVIAGAMKK